MNKVKGFLASLLLTVGTQTTFAQRIVLHLSNQQEVEYHAFEVDSITFKDTGNNSGGAYLIGNLWDYIQAYMKDSKLSTYIWDKRPNVLFYNKDYVPLKGGENWDMALKCFNAQINEREPSYIMVMPTDEAWDKAKEKLARLYRYADKYEDRVDGEKRWVTGSRTIADPDSLANLSMEMDMTCPLIFDRNEQPNDGSYMVSTHGDTLRSTPTWDINSIFNGRGDDAGNSICYMATEWAYPKEYYFPDIVVDVDDNAFYGTEFIHKVGEESGKIDFNKKRFSDFADKYGHVGRNDFYWMAAPAPSTNPVVEIKLTNKVMSAKYDVYAVMVPWWYARLNEPGFADSIRNNPAFADSIAAISKMSFKAQMHYNNNKGSDVRSKQTQEFEYDGTKVDTIKVFEDFEFPYSYKNLRYSYPSLMITGATKAATAKKGFMYGLCIDRIILKSKEE
jgi:hypothetical protein